MLALLRQRNFGLLWFGGLISFIGDWVLFIGLPIYVYTLTGSVLATGLMFIVSILPSILLGSVAGVFVDRWDRKWTMVLGNLIEAPLLLALLAVRSPEQVWIVYVVSLVTNTVGQFKGPAENALLPKLVAEEQLLAANALNTLNNNLARLIGPAIGGAALAYFGFTAAVLIDAGSFVIAGALVAMIAAPASVTRAPREAAQQAGTAASRVLHEWLDGLRLVKQERLVAGLFIVGGIVMVTEGFINVLFVVFVQDILHGGAQEFGWLATAQAVGGLLASLVVGRISKGVRPGMLIAPSLVVNGMILVAIFNIPVLWVDLALFALAGLPIVALMTGVQTLLQTNVADDYRGRVFGALGTTLSLTQLVGRVLATLFGAQIGVVPMMTLGGALEVAAGLLALRLLSEPSAAALQRGAGPAGGAVQGKALVADGANE